MFKKVYRIIMAYKRQMQKKLKRRSPADRLKSRLYYRKNKIKLRIKRRRYIKRTKLYSKTKKLFKRTKPVWYSHKKQKSPSIKKPPRPKFKKPKLAPKIKKPPKSIGSKGYKPPRAKRPKFHVPKRK